MATPGKQPSEVIVGGKRVKITPSMYVAAGGEATIYKHAGNALRIYHDVTAMPPKDRLDDLIKITRRNVVKPIDIISDAGTGAPVGFSMAFVTDTEPLCRFFTKAFRNSNNIGQGVIGNLVVEIQSTVDQLIKEGFLPVDLNELNILPSMKDYTPWFIDIASWATPRFPATAIMDSVRDPVVKGNAFTPGSTWYSFGVIATQLYLGIHPFHGMHPKFKMDWRKRMVENASIFESGVKVPPIVPPFSIIPPSHLDWLRKLFSSSTFRDTPPLPGAAMAQPVTPAAARVVKATGSFSVDRWIKAPYPVVDVYTGYGRTYVVTTQSIYWVEGDNFTPIADRSKYQKAVLVQLNADEVVIALSNHGKAVFTLYGHNGQGSQQIDSCMIPGGICARNGRFYSVSGTQLMEHEIMRLGGTMRRVENFVDNVNDLTVKVFDGVVYQDLFGKAWLTIPYDKGMTVSKPVPALDGYRVIDAKGAGHIVAVIGEKNGQYVQFILSFNPAFTSYQLREVKDQPELNFTVTNNGIIVMLVNDTLELFKDPMQAKVVADPPIDAGTKLLATPNGVFFIDGNEVQKLSVK